MKKPDFARQFTAAMDCRGSIWPWRCPRGGLHAASPAARRRGRLRRVCVLLVAEHPHLRATVLERPPVDEVARTCDRQPRLQRPCLGACAPTCSPTAADGLRRHLFSNVLHDWDVPIVRQLLAASAAALPAGGVVVVHDAHLNEQKTGPLPVAAYSCLLMHSTEGRCYGFCRDARPLDRSGFPHRRVARDLADRSVVVATKG